MTKIKAKSHEKNVMEVKKVIEDYLSGKASLGGAAETAEMSYCDFREELRKRGLLSAKKIGLSHE